MSKNSPKALESSVTEITSDVAGIPEEDVGTNLEVLDAPTQEHKMELPFSTVGQDLPSYVRTLCSREYADWLLCRGKSVVPVLPERSQNIPQARVVYPEHIDGRRVVKFVQTLKRATDVQGNTGAYERFIREVRNVKTGSEFESLLAGINQDYNLFWFPRKVSSFIAKLQTGGQYTPVGMNMVVYIQQIFSPDILSGAFENTQNEPETPKKGKVDRARVITSKHVERVMKKGIHISADWSDRSKRLFDDLDPHWSEHILAPFLSSLSQRWSEQSYPSILEQIQAMVITYSGGSTTALDMRIADMIAAGRMGIKGSYSHIFVRTKQLLEREDKSILIYQYLFFYPFSQKVSTYQGENRHENYKSSSVTANDVREKVSASVTQTTIKEADSDGKISLPGATLLKKDIIQKESTPLLEESKEGNASPSNIPDSAPSSLGALEEFREMLEMSTEVSDILDRFNEFFTMLHIKNRRDLFAYVWLMTQKVRSILVDEAYTKPEKLLCSKGLDRVVKEFRSEKNFALSIPRDLHQFFSDMYDIDQRPVKHR